MGAKALVHEAGMGVDVHGRDSTKAACRAVSDAIRHSSLPLLRTYLEGGGRILIDVTIGAPNPDSVNVEQVQRELPLGEVTVSAVEGGPRGSWRRHADRVCCHHRVCGGRPQLACHAASWARSVSAIRNASSSAWLVLSRGSHAVS